MLKRTTIVTIFIVFSLFMSMSYISCKDTKKEKIALLVKEWQNREILFPSNIVFTRYITDTIDYKIPESDYKILTYVNQSGCVGCQLQLDKWISFIAEVDSFSSKTIPFLFFFNHDDNREINFLLKHNQFDLPVCIDNEDQLNKINKFPQEKSFNSFLLDKNNRIIVIGNPIHNLAIKDLYLTHIKEKGVIIGKTISTTAKVDQEEINLGIFPKTEQRIATFKLRNTGINPLVIVETSTSCGCASVQYDRQPVYEGDVLKVEIRMSPQKEGFFSETITVKCNTDKLIKLKIKGQAR